MTTIARRITGGVDTHLDVHVAAALDERGALLGVRELSDHGRGATWRCWAGSRVFGTVELVGVEGTGSYGAGLTRHLLHRQGIAVVEVDRPNRQTPPAPGKSDPYDAVAAARAAQGGDATGSAKTRDRKRRGHAGVAGRPVLGPSAAGPRPSTRCAASSRPPPTSCAPSCVTSPSTRSSNLASAYRHTGRTDVTTVTKLTLRTLARRALSLEDEVKEIDRLLKILVAEHRSRAQRHRRCGHRRGLGPPGRRR